MIAGRVVQTALCSTRLGILRTNSMYTHIQSLDSRLEVTSLLLSSKGETEKELVFPVPHDILNDDAPKHVLDSTHHASLFEGEGSNV